MDYYQQAIELYDRGAKREQLAVAIPLSGLGRCKLASHDRESAIPFLDRAVAIRDKHPGAAPYQRALAQFALARALWGDAAEHARALSLAAQARAAIERDSRPSSSARLREVEAWLAARRTAGAP